VSPEPGGVVAARTLAVHDVDTVFSLNGGHVWPLYDGCVQEGIRLVDTRHEQTAAFAAEAWAKVTRRVGVAALTAGPGVTNGLSAMTTAWLNGSPVFVVGGRAPQARWGQGSLQELDHVPLVAPVTKHAATCLDPAELASAFDAALVAARTAHRGPTFLDVPLDGWSPVDAVVPAAPPAASLAGPEPDADAVARVAALVAGARRPVLMVGGDVYWAGAEAELRAFVEAVVVPAFANDMGRGVLPADHELAFARTRSTAFGGADLVVVAGTPLDFRLGFGRFGGAAVVHLADTPGGLATGVELAGSAAGDLRAMFGMLTDAVARAGSGTGRAERTDWVAHLRDEERARRESEAAGLTSDASPIVPSRVYGELRARLDRDAVVIGDGGDFVSYAGKYVDTFVPGAFLGPGPYGCLGLGLGYALGAALAQPSRQVVAVLGDGAVGFSLGDLDSLARHGVNVTLVVGNNGIWGLEKHPMQKLFGYDVICDLAPGTRYDRVAVDLGCHGELVAEPGDLGPALDRAFAHDGPSLVNVLTDPADSYPRSSNLA
jgi:thiamine pyrophosphate-dependent acetolactate synthase large subunit-like protein